MDHACLITHSTEPLNAEPTLKRLRAAFVTAPDDFYVRNHGGIPRLDARTHRLQVAGRVRQPLDLSMDELRDRFDTKTVAAVMQCAGNRRADMLRVRPVSGDPWAPGAIGHAEWTGVRLADVLRAAGADTSPGASHVAFWSCDECEADGERFRYGASIPMEKARQPEVLLAWAMGGETLRPEHGYPLRVVVPGYAGVRSPKWLSAIEVRDRPSDNHIQARDYKLLPPHVTRETVEWERGLTINEMPVNSAICEPPADAVLKPGLTTVRGWAIASGRAIARVDVSEDAGRTWQQADLEQWPDSPWSWTFWTCPLDLGSGEHELVVRAWDQAGQTQPALPDDTWNFKGYLSAAWHRVPVSVSVSASAGRGCPGIIVT